jgi:8-oxo-dGTP diphosphatase
METNQVGTHAKNQVAIAILHQNDQFLMQLRDDDPTIFYAGHWGFFGGHLEPGESPDIAIRRELQEEIGHVPAQLQLWQRHEDEEVIRFFYQGELTVAVSELELNEGQDIGLCGLEEIQRGIKYSPRLQEERPLGKPHQNALLTFIASKRE